VPVGVDTHYEGKRPDAIGVFFRNVNFIDNGVAVATPSGRLLAAGTGAWILAEGLAKFEKLPEVEKRAAMSIDALGTYDPQYDLTAADGTTVLKSYIRRLEVDGQGKPFLPEAGDLTIARNGHWVQIDQQPQRDYVWFTPAEIAALVPEDVAVGRTFPLPAAMANRLFIYHIPYSSSCYSWPKKKGEVRGELTLTAEKVTAKDVRLRLSGAVNLGHRFGGVVEFDRARKKLTRFDMAIFHPKAHEDSDRPGQPKNTSVSPLGVAFELASGEHPFDRLYPITFTLQWRGEIGVNQRQIADYWKATP
jgi:hypothetical protein